MTNYMNQLDMEQRVNWMMACNVAKIGVYCDKFETLVEAFRQYGDIYVAEEELIEAQALLRSYDLVPYIISRSTIQARTFQQEWLRHFDAAWGTFKQALRDSQTRELIPEEYLEDEDLKEKILYSYIYYSPHLHIRIAQRIGVITNQSEDQLAQKAIWFTNAAIKSSFANLEF